MALSGPLVRALRAGAILLGALTIAFLWEGRRAADDLSTEGQVVRVDRVAGGSTGDSREFTVRFRHRDRTHQFTTGRGITEQFGRFSDLGVGDTVPVAFDPDDPAEAALDTFFHTRPITATLLAMAGIYVVTIGGLAATGRLSG